MSLTKTDGISTLNPRTSHGIQVTKALYFLKSVHLTCSGFLQVSIPVIYLFCTKSDYRSREKSISYLGTPPKLVN